MRDLHCGLLCGRALNRPRPLILIGIVEGCLNGCLRCGRDPNKPLIRLYAVPLDAFDQNYAEEPLQASKGEKLPTGGPATPAADDD